MKSWILVLKDIGYVFPQLKLMSLQIDYNVIATENYGNCREANLDLGTRKYEKNGVNANDMTRAGSILEAYSELQNWCAKTDKSAVYSKFCCRE